MNRRETIQSFLQNLNALGRAAMARAHDGQAKDIPTRAQAEVMFVLLYQSPQSIKQLAARFGMSSSAATQLVNGLVKEGMLTRSEDAADRRKVSARLSVKGLRTIARIKKERALMITKILQPLSDTELLQLQKIQEKIVEHLKTLWPNKIKNT